LVRGAMRPQSKKCAESGQLFFRAICKRPQANAAQVPGVYVKTTINALASGTSNAVPGDEDKHSRVTAASTAAIEDCPLRDSCPYDAG